MKQIEEVANSVVFAQGVMASLSQSQYAFLLEVQTRLADVIKGVGGIHHKAC
jgi:hypothetical protein